MAFQVRPLDDFTTVEIEEFQDYHLGAIKWARELACQRQEPVGIWNDELKGNQLVAIAYAGDLYTN